MDNWQIPPSHPPRGKGVPDMPPPRYSRQDKIEHDDALFVEAQGKALRKFKAAQDASARARKRFLTRYNADKTSPSYQQNKRTKFSSSIGGSVHQSKIKVGKRQGRVVWSTASGKRFHQRRRKNGTIYRVYI